MKNLSRRRPLGQRLADTVGSYLLAVLLYPFVWVLVRDDRRGGAR